MNDELQRGIADKMNHIGELQRNSERIVVKEVVDKRIDYLKDYTYISLTSLGIAITIIVSDKNIIQSPILIGFGVVLLVVIVIYALIARSRLMNNFEQTSIFIENQYADKYELIEQIAVVQTREQAEALLAELDNIRAKKVPKQPRWVASAHEFMLVPFIVGLVLSALSLTLNNIIALFNG